MVCTECMKEDEKVGWGRREDKVASRKNTTRQSENIMVDDTNLITIVSFIH